MNMDAVIRNHFGRKTLPTYGTTIEPSPKSAWIVEISRKVVPRPMKRASKPNTAIATIFTSRAFTR